MALIMETVLSQLSVSISELKKNPSALLKEADGETIAILNHNKPSAYLVPAEKYAELLKRLENFEQSQVQKAWKTLNETLTRASNSGRSDNTIDDITESVLRKNHQS